MGEVVVSGEEGMVIEETMKNEKKKSLQSDVVRLESILPRMALGVLLVEADDSTRQIITALLRKCSYRVSAVPDGLKAWEALKRRPQSIDLVLTEVELPSISGYALLSLIMEHDICKNIPVIMMSSHDSISVVLKCMLKGAADFLIKPVRRNELRNLWQHVWRRHAQTAGHDPQNTILVKHVVEATSEKSVASNHSSDYLASTKRNKECSDKGSDTQSSCTTPYLEAESAWIQNMQGPLQVKCGSASNLSNTGRHEECVKSDEKSVIANCESGGVASCNEANYFRSREDHICAEALTIDASAFPESQNASIVAEVHYSSAELAEPSSEAIDLISKFENRHVEVNECFGDNDVRDKFSATPHLELSLRRFYTSCSKDEGNDEQITLNHSDTSAFSRYDNSRSLQALFPILASTCSEPKEGATDSHNQLSNLLPDNSFGTSMWHGAALNDCKENITNLVVSQSGWTDAAFLGAQHGIIPAPGLKFDSPSAGYGHMFKAIVHTQSGFPQAWSSKSAGQREQSPFPKNSSPHSSSDNHCSEQGYCPIGETLDHSADQSLQENDDNLEPKEVMRHDSPAPAPSVTAAAIASATIFESVNDNQPLVHDVLREKDSHCSTQREAALLKFRLKRKDRCYEKKVRYQSRKRLAEQRPRVKGQFVRQVRTEPPPVDVDDFP